jgi:hypothetical protein
MVPEPDATPPTLELPIEVPRGSLQQAPDPLRRFLALAAAIRRHEAVTGHRSVARRPRDHALYRRLAELEASPEAPGYEPR